MQACLTSTYEMGTRYKNYPYWVISYPSKKFIICSKWCKNNNSPFNFSGIVFNMLSPDSIWFIEKSEVPFIGTNNKINITVTPDFHIFHCFKTYEEAYAEYVLEAL